jgi:3-dehydroquinate synthase
MDRVLVGSLNPYTVYIGEGILKETPVILEKKLAAKPYRDQNIFIITDRNVSRRYLRPLVGKLKKRGFRVTQSVQNPGEKLKNPSSLNSVLNAMVRWGMTRDSTVVALGGGVIGDFAGFAASIYMRGCHLVQIPTTLLAQVDSSVGGKVGINLKEGKNLAGSFYNPLAVIGDTNTLKTLPAREFVAGFAEIIKYGLISRKRLFEEVEHFFSSHFPDTKASIPTGKLSRAVLGDMEFLRGVILESIKIKADIVTADEREKDLRMILNFGHTFGHALEQITRYHYFIHGEAVLLGMRMAVELSGELGLINPARKQRVCSLLKRFTTPPPKNLTPARVYAQLGKDKKKRGGLLHFIVLEDIGTAVSKTGLPKKIVLDCIQRVLRKEQVA